MHCDVVVIGAGPGGCATAYYLQQAGWRVTLVERRSHPMAKLCGEFLSADGVASLTRLGLQDSASLSSAPSIGEVLISSVSGQSWQAPLPVPGIGWSRQKMDDTLIRHCSRRGVNIIQGLHVHGIQGDDAHGYDIYGNSTTGHRTLKTRLVIGAFGKQSVLHRKLGRQSSEASPLMALKLHIPGGCTPGRVELHLFPGGYVGLCEIEERQTNLCLLTEADVFRHAGCNYERFCKERLALNPLLKQRLDALHPTWQKVMAVANLTFSPQPRIIDGVLMVGDSAASISPLCGDGMSMALRTGELVAPLAHQFLNGELSGQALRQTYDQQWRQEFSRRLRLGGMLQHLFFKPVFSKTTMALLHKWPSIGQRLIRWTRGQVHVYPDNSYAL